jgi:hypothetical protein
MKIITESVRLNEIKTMAKATFGNLVKAVVDVDREIIAVDAKLHSDNFFTANLDKLLFIVYT